jgi:hypothetical protein
MMMTTLSKPWKISNKRLSSSLVNTAFFTIPGCLLFAFIGFIAFTNTLEINKGERKGFIDHIGL